MDVQVLWCVHFSLQLWIFSENLFENFKIRIKVLSHPSVIELTSSTNTLGTNSIPQNYLYGMTTTTISRRWPRTLPPAAPHHTLVDYQQELTRSGQQYKNIISWLTIINHPSLYAAFIRNIQPSMNDQCTGVNRAYKLFAHHPTKAAPSFSYNYLPFPSVTTYPLTQLAIPHFSFLSWTVPK